MGKNESIRQLLFELLLTSAGLSILFFYSCNNTATTSNEKSVSVTSPTVIDTTYHGYNELANPDRLKSFTISDFNTDNPEIKNIDRPNSSTISTQLDTVLLFDIWTNDPEGPHADFVFSSKSFYVVDYDGDGNMPYILTNNKLKIYYNDFIQEGDIISVDNDTLKIKWNEYDYVNYYVRWKQ